MTRPISGLDVPLAVLVARQREAAAVEEWNRLHPIGTPVTAYPGLRPEDDPGTERLTTCTRSKAALLGGHTAVVWVHGHGACIALTHVDLRTRATAGEAAEYRHLLDASEAAFAQMACDHPEACTCDDGGHP
ncbi:hypothetical protein [Streptomyces sp. NPDC088789]|uniref:hypothetical protein n=1 Tax=Streptomyces sp. NPDC088789 TaxID=3365899 RepID=UPI0037F38BFB